MNRLARLFLLFALLLPLSVAALHAQAAAGVDGTVLDPDSKAVVNAAVVVRNEASGSTVATTTDGRGHFAAPDVSQGSYAIEVFVPGFEPIRRAGVQVREGAATTVSIQLSVANISETVTATTTANVSSGVRRPCSTTLWMRIGSPTVASTRLLTLRF